MNLAPMRYKGYVFPHNPRIYGIRYERKIAVGKVPFGRYTMKNMGMSYRVLSGEGEFVGDGAYDEFKKLATIFYDEGPGALYHPIWQLSNAYFVSLTLEQEPTENYVKYSFEFWEDYNYYRTDPVLVKSSNQVNKSSAGNTGNSGNAAANTTVYTVVSGDTMWAIAKKYGVTLSALIDANPQVKNPNLIYVGDKLTIPGV